jgi:hypothetical protein
MRVAGHVACMAAKKRVYRVLVGRAPGKKPLASHRKR